MYLEVLIPAARRLLPRLGARATTLGFYLAGGTALALQFGHRRSVDFDWFSPKQFSPPALREQLSGLGRLTVTAEAAGTFHGVVDRVRVSFLTYAYQLLYPLRRSGTVRLADARDIACMKLQAISSRGSKKDFFDLYVLLQHYSLSAMLRSFERKYRGVRYNRLHLLKSLVYFRDADREPTPVLLQPISWRVVKQELSRQAEHYLQ